MNEKIELMIEAERRGILPTEKQALLAEARKRGLVDGGLATPEQQDLVDVPSRVAKGAMDPITGLAQMLYNAVPESVQKAGTKADKWLYDKTGGIVGADRNFNQKVVGEEQQYQQARQATGQNGVDLARIGGNLASTVPLAFAGPQMAAASLPARIGVGAAEGGLFGAAQPVTQGDYWQEKGKQTLAGGAFGAAAAPVAGAVARVIKPKSSPEAQLLMKEGVTPSAGQMSWSPIKFAEEKARSLPIMGDLISSANRRSIAELNRAAYNRALRPIGKSAKKFPVGRDGLSMVKQELGKAYDEVLPKLTFQADDVFHKDITKLSKMAATLPEAEAKQFDKILREQVVGKMTPAGRMSGESIKSVEEQLGKIAKGYKGDSSFDKRQLGDAVAELQASIRNTLVRSNPKQAKRLQAINKGYSNYAILRKAGGYSGAEEGFTAAQLSQAVKAMDKSVGKGSFATGKANMQDLADAGKKVLGSKVPNSGTFDRAIMNGMAIGSGAYSPAIPIGLGLAGLPYAPGMRNAMAAILAKRPPGAGLLAGATRQASPALAAPVYPLLAGEN